MSVERIFLGWDQPVLPLAATWLREHLAGDGQPKQPDGSAAESAEGIHGAVMGSGMMDLSHVLVVVPASRAGRRLIELLTEPTATAALPLHPPRVVTLGQLPEQLYEPPLPLAEPMPAMLARVAALGQADEATLRTIVDQPPEQDDFSGWFTLAEQLRDLRDDLAAWQLTPADVPQLAAERGLDLSGEARWQALAGLEQAYEAQLQSRDWTDEQIARRHAIAHGSCQCRQHIVLLACADINAQLLAMLRQLACPMTALIAAPQAHTAGFDAFGSLDVAYWRKQQVTVADQTLHIVNKPHDQAMHIVRILAQWRDEVKQAKQQPQADAATASTSSRLASQTGTLPPMTADQITIALGDQTQAGLVRRTLSLASVPARFAAGKPLHLTGPVMLLDALGRFWREHQLNDFAQLLRHPDIAHYLLDTSAQQQSIASKAIDHWLTLLDDYATQHLQQKLDGHWLGNSDRTVQLKAVYDRIMRLISAVPHERRPLSAWSQPIAQALTHIYGQRTFSRFAQQDHDQIHALSCITQMLREHAAMAEDDPLCPRLTFSQAVALLLKRLHAMSVPEPAGQPAIELVGYLELAFDDAPRAMICSMNEGCVPASRHADAFLPDGLRHMLGMADDQRRYARDLYLLNIIIHNRPSLALITCRQTQQSDPLAPSRLLLACDDQTLIDRVQLFYEESPQAAPAAPLLLRPGKPAGEDGFIVPPPMAPLPTVESLRVTDFRLYLACPYRFYLQRILQLGACDDQVVEMDAMQFGVFAHETLQHFAQDGPTDATDPGIIAAYLHDKVDALARDRFGARPRPAVRVQLHRLRERLTAFAQQQAQWTRQGWQIQATLVERRCKTVITIDGEPITITGTIDRVDHHPEHGYRILDYKTSDTPHTPEQTHRHGPKDDRQWVDLQLPLYLTLVKDHGIADNAQLGYINLPKKLDQVKLVCAQWDSDDLDDAMAVRDQVVRAIRRGIFWPPVGPTPRLDELSGICADEAPDRPELLQRSAQCVQGGAAS